MTFWLIITLLAMLVALSLLLALLRRRAGAPPAAEIDIAVYRDQLAEVDRDLARGVIGDEAAERTRLEISRRILEADKARADDAAMRAPRALSLGVGAILAVILVGGSLALYFRLGAPGYGDLPLQARIEASRELRANRPGQEAAERQAAAVAPERPVADPEHAALVQRLRETLADRPDDAQGLRLLARNEAALGNFAAARRAQGHLLEVLGARATADDYADQADLLILAAGGYVSPEAEAVLQQALARDPSNGAALYYVGLLHAQTGRPDLAFRIWRELLERSAPDDPWVAPVRAQIGEAAARAGIRYDLPPEEAPAGPRGPTAADVEAAADMTPEARAEMIRGMVAGLSDRLAAEGGPPEDWARLIGALGVLGDTEQAQAIWTEAQQVFAGNDTALAMLDAAAARAGLSR